MKKIILLAIVATTASLTSCKKNYTCTCTYNYTGGTAETYTIRDTKSNATTTCNSYATGITSCSIK